MDLKFVESPKECTTAFPVDRDFPRRARILVCDWPYTIKSWSDALFAQRKKFKKDAFEGDIFVLGGTGYEVLRCQGKVMSFVPTPLSRSDAKLGPEVVEALTSKLLHEGQISCLEHYESIEIVAHGSGVRLAATFLNALPQEWFETKSIRGIALGGTILGDFRGEAVPDLGARNSMKCFTIANLEQLYLNQLNTDERFFSLRGRAKTKVQCPANQTKFRTKTELKKRLQECAEYQLGADYAKCAAAVSYDSANYFLFTPSPRIAMGFMVMPTSISMGKYEFTQSIRWLSAELVYSSIVPLGANGRDRFNQCFKLHYGYSGDLMCLASDIAQYVKSGGAKHAQMRELPGPHLNCQQICELLLQIQHPDWDEVGQRMAQGK